MRWEKRTLGELTASIRPICYGVLKPGDFIDDGIPLVRVTDISKNHFDSTNLYRISTSLDEEFARSRLEGGEILLSIQGTVGRVAIAPPEMKGANISRTIAIISPDDRVDRRYLYHYLRKLGDASGFYISGTTRASLNISELRSIEIPLPPLEEQRRIAAILDKSHSIQGLFIQRHQMMQALINSMLISGFGSPSEWPLKWKMQKLGDCCECLDKHRRPVKESERQEGDIPYYGANGQQGWINDFLFDESLVLVAEDGGHFADRMRGVAYRIDGKAWVNNHAHILRPRGNDLEIEFLHRILRHYDFMPYISGSTRSKLTQGQLNEVLIPVPPIDRQRSFSRCVERLASSMNTSSMSLEGGAMLSRSLAKSLLECET